MVALHGKRDVFSRRHVPSWLLLTFAAGSTNATAAVAAERYVTHVTGTVTRIGTELGSLGVFLLDFLALVVAFVAGAVTSALLVNARVHRGKRPFYATPLLVVAALTVLVAITGQLTTIGDVALIGVLAFASGLQNASVATSTGSLVRTTHLTGPATDLGVHLVDAMFTHGDTRKHAFEHVLLRAGKIAAFAAGACCGALLGVEIAYLALVVPAVVIFIATAVSYLPYRERMVALADGR